MYPFTAHTDKSIGSIGEAELIKQIRSWLGETTPMSPYGIGDDCAVLRKKTNLSAIDPVIFGKHFDDSISPENAGAKLLKRNLSDIAAMGGEANDALLALTIAPNLRLDWIERFIKGIRQTARQFNVSIIGGDVTEAPNEAFFAYLAISGFAKNPLTRNGAKPGDSIWVTGTLGGSILRKHYAFEPRLSEGQWLAESNRACSMIDLTDGLAKDLPELIPSGTAALLDLSIIPLSDDAKTLSTKSGRSPLAHAFTDGEDYELALTLDSKNNKDSFLRAWNNTFDLTLTCIGHIEKSDLDKCLINAATGKTIDFGNGYEHLKR